MGTLTRQGGARRLQESIKSETAGWCGCWKDLRENRGPRQDSKRGVVSNRELEPRFTMERGQRKRKKYLRYNDSG
jgi:hypothetical protein